MLRGDSLAMARGIGPGWEEAGPRLAQLQSCNTFAGSAIVTAYRGLIVLLACTLCRPEGQG